MITLTLGVVTLNLPDALIWTDEFGWSAMVSSHKSGSTGALIIHEGKRQAGRPITLDGVDSKAWITRDECDKFYAWLAIPGAEFDLVVRGMSRRVKFDNSQGAGFTARAQWRLFDSEHDGQTDFLPIFKFIEI